ncbi:hypothetical protein IMZ48_16040 [Candidatus Bathyarchaeota archaeon]|nr:hypothetical protein [Candidatus Bathyarchaeota archaeon]
MRREGGGPDSTGYLIIYYANDEHLTTPTSPFLGHRSDLSAAHSVQSERQSLPAQSPGNANISLLPAAGRPPGRPKPPVVRADAALLKPGLTAGVLGPAAAAS